MHRFDMHALHSKLLPPLLALILTAASVAAVWLLIQRADSERTAQLLTSSMTFSLSDLQSAPFNAEPNAGGLPTVIRAEIRADERSITRGLMPDAQSAATSALLATGRSQLAAIEPVVTEIVAVAVRNGLSTHASQIAELQDLLTVSSELLAGTLAEIGSEDAASAGRARQQAKLGSAAALVLLLLAFAYFYFRAISAREAVERLARENESLLGISRVEARTDALTGLGNRRALASDLSRAIADPPAEEELLLAIFDLDGFKQYNDSFGHAAGDALLKRLGGRLARSAGKHRGSAYRMGGDEFCVLAPCAPDAAEKLLDDAVGALQDGSAGWHVSCSHGAVWMPSEADTESSAFKLADERMYANKASRSSASRQATDVLLQVISEQNASLDGHVTRVSNLAGELAEALELPEHAVQQIRLAGNLHDVGMLAVPDTILSKRGPLDEEEWRYIHSHPLIGERIAMAAPALAHVAPLIRSVHERIDGHGYPDGLVGDSIAQGSRIIAVCDAFDAMTSPRAHQAARSVEAALQELEDHAGSQFDQDIVATFREMTAHAQTQLEFRTRA
jgi:diguanylate cyclase (GGDEF)-like protein